MVVYIVIRGEKRGGYHILEVCSRQADAEDCALDQDAHFDDKEWHPMSGREGSPNLYWENGCDYVAILAKILR